MVDFSFWYFLAIFILGEDYVHTRVIQEIKAIMNEHDLKVDFVWIDREGMLSYNDLIDAISDYC